MNIFIIIGSSGSGKTTISELIKDEGYWEGCISHTTRDMRDGELDGKDYYFISKDNFDNMLKNDEFAEYIEYSGNHYGLSKGEINRISNSGVENMFIIAEHNGFEQLKEIYPDAKSIFIYSTKGDCMTNMFERGDSVNSVMDRMSRYDGEFKHKDNYDYFVINTRGRLSDAKSKVIEIINKYNED